MTSKATGAQRRRRTLAVTAAAGVVAALAQPAQVAAASGGVAAVLSAPNVCSQARAWADFNGDGCPDLAIGAPDHDVNGSGAAGLVEVRYGASPTVFTNRQSLTQGPVIGASPEPGDRFGASLAVGDFNTDGYDDLAVGVPGEDVGTISDAGAVHLVFGSAAGLGRGSSPGLFLPQGRFPRTGAPETGDRFGTALDADGTSLLVGTPYEDVTSIVDAGAAVQYLFSGQGSSFTASGHFMNQGSYDPPWAGSTLIRGTAERGDHFGAAVSIWGPTIGAPEEDLGPVVDAGVVTRRSDQGAGLSWTQLYQGDFGLPDHPEPGDHFGAALGHIVGACWQRGLVIGVPGEDVGTVVDAGGVHQLNDENIVDGPVGSFLTQDSPGVPGVAERSDGFGSAVTVVEEPSDDGGQLMVAVGSPGEDVGAVVDAGSVTEVATMAVTGCVEDRPASRLWTQDSPGVPGVAETGDRYGSSLSTVYTGADSATAPTTSPLLVGMPGEDNGAGAVQGPLETSGGFWQSSPVQAGARFGTALRGPAG